MTVTQIPPTSAAGATAARRVRRPVRGVTLARRSVSPLLLLVAWQAASTTGLLPEDTLAAPSVIADALAELVRTGVLQDAAVVSVQRVVIGFAIGAVIGVALALVAGLSRIGEDAIDPPMQMLRTLPHFGLISLFIIWMGIDEAPKITLIAMGVAFPLYLNTFAGIRGVEPRLLEAARTFGMPRLQIVRHVVLPGALPSALTGLRLSLGIAWLSLIVAETINSTAGIGWIINDAREFGRTDVIVAGLLVYSLLGLLTDALVRTIERKALQWRQA